MGNDCCTDGTKSKSGDNRYVATKEKDHDRNVGRQHGQSNEGMSGNPRNGQNRRKMPHSKGGQNTHQYRGPEGGQHVPSTQSRYAQPGEGHTENPIGDQYQPAQNSQGGHVKGDKKKKGQNQASSSDIHAYIQGESNEQRLNKELVNKEGELKLLQNRYQATSDTHVREMASLRQDRDNIKKEKDSLLTRYRETSDNHAREMASLLQDRDKIKKEKDSLLTRYRETSDNYVREMASLRQDRDKIKKEKDSLLTRYSALAGSKLTDGNANIADLSDENRPTKIAEQYTELYDNEWTDAFTVLSEDKTRPSDNVCHTIAKAFCITYQTARQEADNDLKKFVDAMKLFLKTDTLPSEVLKDVKDRRKKKPGSYSDTIRKLYRHDMAEILSSTEQEHVSTFLMKSIDICWLMAIQDPPLYVDTDLSCMNKDFNTDYFKPYTATGKFIDFIVWPTLYLFEGGSVLSKGIAQGMTFRRESQHYDNVEIKRDTAENGLTTSTPSIKTVLQITNENITKIPNTKQDKRGNYKENTTVSNPIGNLESSVRHKSQVLHSTQYAGKNVSPKGEGHTEKNTTVPKGKESSSTPGPETTDETNSRPKSYASSSHDPSANHN